MKYMVYFFTDSRTCPIQKLSVSKYSAAWCFDNETHACSRNSSVSHSEATHNFFCVWLDNAIPTEDMWKIIMEDKLYDYSSEQDTSNNDVIVASEISVNTLNGVQATEGDLTASSNED